MGRKDVDTLGSPVYQIVVPDIPNTEFMQFTVDVGVYTKYIPFDYISILNTQADTFELVLNDNSHFAIPASSHFVLSDIPFRRFRINNDSGNALVGANMYISIQHTPTTADKAARKPKGLMDYIPLAGFLMR